MLTPSPECSCHDHSDRIGSRTLALKSRGIYLHTTTAYFFTLLHEVENGAMIIDFQRITKDLIQIFINDVETKHRGLN